MAAQYPGALPVFTGTTETAPATTTPSPFAAWATKVADEIVALAQDKSLYVVKYTSGNWYVESGQTNTHTPSTGTLIVSPYSFPPGTTLVGLAEFVITGIASGVRRLGVYADNGSHYPGALLVDAGTYASTTSTTWNQAGGADFSAVAVGGTVWIGGVSQTAAAGVGGYLAHGRGLSPGTTLASLPGNNNPWEGYSQASVTGTLPDPFTSTRTLQTGAPRVAFKVG